MTHFNFYFQRIWGKHKYENEINVPLAVALNAFRDKGKHKVKVEQTRKAEIRSPGLVEVLITDEACKAIF